MATVTDTALSIWTASEIIARFGDIPIARIRTTPPPGEATESDVIELHDHHDRLFELIDGTLVEKTMGWKEAELAVIIATLLRNFVQANSLGKVFGADGMFRLEPEQIRIPDVAFIAKQRFAGRTLASGAFWDLGCDLAVEVISPGNTQREMERKLEEYFEAGVRLVWYVEPREKKVTVYTRPDAAVVLGEADQLTGGEVLPGLVIELKELFAAPKAPGK